MLSVLISAMIFAVACNGGNTSERSSVDTKDNLPVSATMPDAAPDLIEMVSPAANAKYASGETITVLMKMRGSIEPDSVSVWFNGIQAGTVTSPPWEYSLSTESAGPGNTAVKLMAYRGGRRPQTVTRLVTMLSDIVPEIYGYRIVNKYPHDREAYTQGLLVHNGYFYESTGQYGESGLRHVEIETGRVIKQHSLDKKYFGEGLALYAGRLYQLTWTTNTGFVYDIETFSEPYTIIHRAGDWLHTVISLL